VTSKVFLDVQIADKAEGRIVVGLFGNTVPKTVENFRSLASGEKGKSGFHTLHYKGTKFHRIIPGFMCQGGDFYSNDGKGGESIYPGQKFEDENFKIKHSAAGYLSMANSGPNTNKSQFFITFKACHHLDGKHVVFGKVLENMELVRKIEEQGNEDKSGKPLVSVVISNCGELNSDGSVSLPSKASILKSPTASLFGADMSSATSSAKPSTFSFTVNPANSSESLFNKGNTKSSPVVAPTASTPSHSFFVNKGASKAPPVTQWSSSLPSTTTAKAAVAPVTQWATTSSTPPQSTQGFGTTSPLTAFKGSDTKTNSFSGFGTSAATPSSTNTFSGFGAARSTQSSAAFGVTTSSPSGLTMTGMFSNPSPSTQSSTSSSSSTTSPTKSSNTMFTTFRK